MKKLLTILFVMFLMVSPMNLFAAEGDIIDVATKSADPKFTILAAALEKADLVTTLQGDGPFTVFAPTDEAFEALLKKLDITADELLARKDLKDILLYHVISGKKVMAADLTEGMMPMTAQGTTLKISLKDGASVNGVKVIAADVGATNGVIHVIGEVLLPTAPTTDVPGKDGIPDTAVVGMLPYAGLAMVSVLGLVALKKRK